MQRLRWARLREATSASSEPQLQRAGTQPEPKLDADLDYDEDGQTKDCPKCDSGLMADGSTCPTCNGAATVPMRESMVYWLRESVSADERKKAHKEGHSLPDESYPIQNREQLGAAVTLARSKHGDWQAAETLIKRRAEELGAEDMLPDEWKTRESTMPLEQRNAELESLLAATTARLREANPEVLGSTFSPVNAATAGGAKGYEVVLIREGLGNSEDGRWYTKHAVQELVSSGACEGMQAYADHPTLDEEEFLPERSVKDVVGSYRNVTLAESNGRAEARAVFVPIQGTGYEWVTTLAEAAVGNRTGKPLVGISLYGAAAGEDRERPDGSFGAMADLVRPTSGDIVTNAGAGGEFVRRLMESARAERRALHTNTKGTTPMTLKELQAKMRESARKLREADTDEKRSAAVTELEQLETVQVDPDIAELTEEKLKESQPTLYTKIRESAKAEVKIPATAPEADTALRQENEDLKGKLRESDKTIAETNGALIGIKVMREAKIPADEADYYLSKFREAGAVTEDAMKAVLDTEKQREDRIVARVRESVGLDFVEGMPGNTGATGEGLIDLSEDGIPMIEEKVTA
jgi:hypothetical protein